MTSPAPADRRFAAPAAKPPSQSPSPAPPIAPRLRAALPLLLLVALLLRGQLYIAATFAGTRPRAPRRLALPAASALDPAWDHCAALIAAGLSDIGDAGRVWLRHAYVGSNPLHAAARAARRAVDRADAADDGGGDDDGGDAAAEGDKYRCRCLIPQVHVAGTPGDGVPHISAIVQSFNHHGNIGNISTALQAARGVDEIVISEDGSTDGSLADWHAALRGDAHFIVRSNNLHELRSYNRAMRMSSGDLVVLLQDDDRLPLSDSWVRNAVRLFDALPDLGVLGGYVGQLWEYDTGRGLEFGEQTSTHGGLRGGDTKPIQFIEPRTNLPFMYAECVWIAPVFIRRDLLRKAGGLELTIAKRNEPGVWQDCVFSYEAWVNGYTVGVYSALFERGVGGHGSASSTLKVKKRERVYDRAVAYANRKFQRRRIHDAVERLNNDTLQPRHFESAAT